MPMTSSYALAHVFLPNLVKLKSGAAVIHAIERDDRSLLDGVWVQAHVTHKPVTKVVLRDPYRIAVISLPAPVELGEAFMVGIVVKKTDVQYCRYFTLEKDHVLAKKLDRTLICEREGQKHTKHREGPALTGNLDTDLDAFLAAFMEVVEPTTVDADRRYR
jgi:hypothetical protein